MNAIAPNNMTAESKRGKWTLYITAFAVPVLMFFLLCAYMGRYPFGSQTILDMDLPGQYIHFFTYLKGILAGENDLFYTFSKTLGGDMNGLAAYYLLSPLNLIFILIPETAFPMGCTVLVALKLGLCGLSMAIYLDYMALRHRDGERHWNILFSSAYALMSYNIVYFSNIMWIDAVYVLPIMILGIERLMNRRSGLVYTLSLAYALICNYYTGYMLCLFSVFYFAFRFSVYLFRKEAGSRQLVLRYALYSLLAGGLSAFVLLPTFLSLAGTKANLDTAKLAMFCAFPLKDFILRLYSNSVLSDLSLQNLPYLYTGLLSNVLLALYFFNHKIRLYERLICAAFLFILLLSFDLNGCYLIWHGFNYPACFPFRNAFVGSFMMLHLAWQCFIHRDGLSTGSYAAAAAMLAAAVAVSSPFSNPDLSNISLIIDIVVSALILVLLALEKYRCGKRLCFAVLALFQLIFLSGNSIYLKTHATNGAILDAAEYSAQFEKANSELSFLSARDNSFYRISAAPDHTNEPMQLGYASVSHFSSTDKSAVKDFMARFGYRFFRDSWVSYGNGACAATDSLFSIKYLRSDTSSHKNYPVIFEDDSGTVIAENPNALGIAFIADEAVLTTVLENRNPFLRQNQAFSAILGRPVDIFSSVESLDFETRGISRTNDYKDATVYFCDDAEADFAFVYRFKAANSDPVYMYTYAPYFDHVDLKLVAQLYVNGEYFGEYMGAESWETVFLGCFEAGEEIEVTIKPSYEYFVLGESYIYHENLSLLSECAREIKMRTGGAELEKDSSSSLSWTGNLAQQSQVLLLTVPNERGWALEIDGEAANISSAFDTLMAIEMQPGEHRVELRYIPAGFRAGLILSAFSAAFLVVPFCAARKKQK